MLLWTKQSSLLLWKTYHRQSVIINLNSPLWVNHYLFINHYQYNNFFCGVKFGIGHIHNSLIHNILQRWFLLCFFEIIRKTREWGDKYKFMENYKTPQSFYTKTLAFCYFYHFIGVNLLFLKNIQSLFH